MLLTQEQFINRAISKHDFKYNYKNAIYVNFKTKLKIICKIHGTFDQTPESHLKGRGCPKCAKNSKYSEDEILLEFRNIHGDIYEYDLSSFTTVGEKIKITCFKHGTFEQTSKNHIAGNGCPKCGYKSKTNEEWIKDFKNVHGDTYNYDNFNLDKLYKGKITCNNHGDFLQKAHSHKSGNGCPHCKEVARLSKKDFIKKSNEIHENKYDYSKVIYINNRTNIIIICPIHGEFEQVAGYHLCGSGCQCCYKSKGEKKIHSILESKNINFETQKKFNKCKNIRNLPFDFYLSDYNLCIEYDGKQHFESIEYFGGQDGFKERQINDKIKTKYCIDNNIKLIRIPYWNFENIEEILLKNT